MTRRRILIGMGLGALAALPLACGPKDGGGEGGSNEPPEPPMPGKEEGDSPDATEDAKAPDPE